MCNKSLQNLSELVTTECVNSLNKNCSRQTDDEERNQRAILQRKVTEQTQEISSLKDEVHMLKVKLGKQAEQSDEQVNILKRDVDRKREELFQQMRKYGNIETQLKCRINKLDKENHHPRCTLMTNGLAHLIQGQNSTYSVQDEQGNLQLLNEMQRLIKRLETVEADNEELRKILFSIHAISCEAYSLPIQTTQGKAIVAFYWELRELSMFHLAIKEILREHCNKLKQK